MVIVCNDRGLERVKSVKDELRYRRCVCDARPGLQWPVDLSSLGGGIRRSVFGFDLLRDLDVRGALPTQGTEVAEEELVCHRTTDFTMDQ